MKTCLTCGAQSPDNIATCPKCGEASWSTVEQKPANQPQGKRR